MAAIELTVIDEFLVTDSIRSSPQRVIVEDRITLSSSLRSNQHIQDIKESLLRINDALRYRYGKVKKTVSDRLEFHYIITRPTSKSISQSIQLTHKIKKVQHETISQTLSLSDSFNYPGQILITKITISDSVSFKIIKDLRIADTLEIGSYPHGYKLIHTFIGIPPTFLGSNNHVSFSCHGQQINLRAPDLGDKDSILLKRINRNSRGHDLIYYRDDIWRKTETISLEFSYLKPEDIASLKSFLLYSLGREVFFTDEENKIWYGIISNPIGDFTEEGRHNFKAVIEFEGVHIG